MDQAVEANEKKKAREKKTKKFKRIANLSSK